MGDSNFNTRVSNRIFKSSTKLPRDKGDKPPIRTFRKIRIVRRGKRFITKISYRSGSKRRKPKRLLQPILFGPQKERRFKTNIKSETLKQTCEISAFQDANFEINHTSIAARRLGSKTGFKRCLFSHSNSSQAPKIPQVCSPGKMLSVSCTSFWSDFSPTNIHQDNVSSGSSPSQTTDPNFHVPRRLAHKVIKSKPDRGISFKDCSSDSKIRTDSKLGKIPPNSSSKNRLPGHGLRFKRRKGVSNTGKILTPLPVHSDHKINKRDTCKMHSENTRFNGSMHRHDSVRQVAHAANSAISVVQMEAKHPVNRKIGINNSSLATPPRMVEGQVYLFQRDKSEFSRCPYDANNGCVQNRMGRAHGDVASKGYMGSKDSIQQTHKLVRAQGSISEPQTFPTRSSESSNNVENRQLNSSIIYKQAGGNQIPRTVCVDMGIAKVVSSTGNHLKSSPHSRKKERHSRQAVQRSGRKTHRMGVNSDSGRPNISNLGETPHRPVCNTVEQEATNILFSSARLKCGSDRCILNMLGGDSCVCIPSNNNDSKITEQGSKGKLCSNTSSSSMAKAKLVPTTVKTVDRIASETTPKGRPSIPESRERLASRSNCPKLGSMEVVKERRVKKGFSERAAKIMASTRRTSTTGTYDARLKRYYSWCRKRHVDPTTAPITVVADFLQELFDVQKFSPNTIAGYRAAISIIHEGHEGTSLGQNRDLRDLIVGMSQLRPIKKSLLPNWSLPLVLNRLIKEPFEPLQSADLKFVTLKTAFLIAVASGRRVSEIHALSVDSTHLRWEKAGVRMRTNPHFMAKNESLRNPGKDIFLAKFDTFTSVKEDKLLCPCRALKIYLKKVAPIRESHSQLFLTHKKGAVQNASKRTIARWVVETVRLAYEKANQSDLNLARAHDTRALSTSWALFQGVKLQEIMTAAFWAAESTFTSFYLKDVVSDESAFSLALLKTAKTAI